MQSILPILKEHSNCIEYTFNYIHDYDVFIKDIINPIIKSEPDIQTKLLNTSNHMFNVVGYGVFVSIKDRKIFTFQPFANTSKPKPGTDELNDTDLSTFTQHKIETLNIKDELKDYHTITQNRNQWVFSDCIFFYWENWWKDIELYLNIYYDMLITTCEYANKNTSLQFNDTHFFINLFDQPVAFKKDCDRYIQHDIICSNNKVRESSPFIKIFSGSTTENHYDSCMVYADAWEVATQKKFGKSCRDWYFNKQKEVTTNWESKKNMITFRGRNSSCYPNDENKNDRLKVIKILKDVETSIEKDIGLSGVVEQTLYVDGKLITSDKQKIKNIVGEFISPKTMIEQSKSKFIVDIDGYVTPWRLVFELSYCSVILLFKSKYTSWFYDKLKHLENIYIIDTNENKNIVADINTAVNLFSNDDESCKRMATGAGELFKYLSNVDNLSKYMIDAINNKSFENHPSLLPTKGGTKKTRTQTHKTQKRTKMKTTKHKKYKIKRI